MHAGMAAGRAEPRVTDGAAAQPMHGQLLARVLERDNLQRALKQVRRNKGAPGIDGMSVDALPEYLKHRWLDIRAGIEGGRYSPQPVRRVEIAKPDGRKRMLGIPTVLDRLIQQAIAQVIQAQWEPHFHPDSYGFRPQRSAHQAVRKLQADVKDGRGRVVNLDLESFFDRVNHDRLMHRLQRTDDDDAMSLRFAAGRVAHRGVGCVVDGPKFSSSIDRGFCRSVPRWRTRLSICSARTAPSAARQRLSCIIIPTTVLPWHCSTTS